MGVAQQKKDLELLVRHPEWKERLFPAKRLEQEYKQLSRLVLAWDTTKGTRLSHMLGFDLKWREQVLSGNRQAYSALLNSGGDEHLFYCFQQAFKNRRFLPELKKWLDYQGLEKGLILMGLRSKGDDFDGKSAMELFSPIKDALRRLAVHHDHSLRFTVLRILVHDDDEASRRILWQALRDTYAPIREVMCRSLSERDRDRFYNELYRLLISDPARSVRTAARDRISSDFTDLYSINPERLSSYERIHALEHLDPRLSADMNAALGFLNSPNREERLTAAHFLQQTGSLEKLLLQSDAGDRLGLDRIVSLLSGAVDVGVIRFMDVLAHGQKAGVLIAGLRLLLFGGPQNLVFHMIRSVLELDPAIPEFGELLALVSELIQKRGDRDCYRIVGEALSRLTPYSGLLTLLLKNLPSEGAPYFKPILMNWLKEPACAYRNELETILKDYPPALILGDCYDLLHDPSKIAPVVRQSVLRILAATGEDCVMQNILENMTLIPPDEVPALAMEMKRLSGDRYTGLLTRLLETRDTELRCLLIDLIPETGSEEHTPFLDEAIEDPDSAVRISLARAVSRMGDKARMKSALVLLHDPDPEVRTEAVRWFASSGSDVALAAVRSVLDQDHELSVIKISALKGLARSATHGALELILENLSAPSDISEAAISVLAECGDSPTLLWLIQAFTSSLPPVRERLVEVFVRMGERGESGLLELLRRKDPVMTPPLTEILTRTGAIPVMADRLKNPHPEERMQAALDLLTMGTPETVRYAVMALRDVKKEIRKGVLNHLKSQHAASGQTLKSVIETMSDDPDPDTRKLAAWTLQRLKA